MIKKNGWIWAGIFLLFILFSSPFWLWMIQPHKELNVLIVDKTVPDTTYREHKGIIWLLNHLKLKKTGDAPYEPDQDYVGFVPTEEPPKFQTRELPEDLADYDVLYVADSYGVYKEDYITGKKREGNRSELLYGGMTMDEVRTINASLIANNQTLIAEFNTFGSPTEQQVREAFYHMLNVRWTGWMGRYFDDLTSEAIPGWIKNEYEKQHQKAFSYQGRGMIFVSEEEGVIVLTDEDLTKRPVTFELTERGEKTFKLDENIQYNYWFDVIEAEDEQEVAAAFKLGLSEEGKEALKASGMPLAFPAVVHHQANSYDSYYFAGDFADQEKLPSIYQMKGIPLWQKLLTNQRNGRTDAFYWKAYVPMMEKILTDEGVSSKEKASSGLKPAADAPPIFTTDSGMKLAGHADDEYVQIYQDGKWEDLLIKGVNMGIAKPGSFPGETAISKDEYARWFKQISEMNANALRVYTIHPPAFYEALYEHNRNRKEPLYLFQGVWVNEETFIEKKNAFDPAVTDDFKAEIKRTVDLIHGNADLEERAGHASGKYVHDLSPYLLGWIIGVEWDPDGVVGTNEKNPERTEYDGTYIMTEKATPFEVWIAEMMDYTATYEAEQYQWQRPMSFTNWVTTDLLKHPAEPSEKEDMVSVNPNLIKAKDTFQAGLFASYHIYPYYPDFLNYEEKYVGYTDHRGKKNNYAGYLNDMKQHHQMPLLVAEFGIPASRGMTHENVYGFNQGFHTEQEQGRMLKSLFEDIVEEGLAGGLVFSWQDEWFKRTWNTMDYDNPDRRPFWDNIQTNEQHFGLLSFDPDTPETQLLVDGSERDWEKRGETSVYAEAGRGPLKDVYVASDVRGLYFRFDYDLDEWNEDVKTTILLDTIKDQGQSTVPGLPQAREQGIDFVVELDGKDNSRVWIDSYYDTFYYEYGHVLDMIPIKPYAGQKNNGVYHPIRLTLNKELTIHKEEGDVTYPFSAYETGKLRYGNGNPDSDAFDSLADVSVKDGMLEVRLPWLLLNVKDPSQKQIMGDMWTKGGIKSAETIESISAAVLISNGDEELVQRIPEQDGEWLAYTWANWEEPKYHERLKKSYAILQNFFKEIRIKED